MRKLVLTAFLTFFALGIAGAHATTRVVAVIDKPTQTMYVSIDGQHMYTWDVSTAAPGSVTPSGTYNPYWLSEHHRSSLYNNAPMPFSVFFYGNYAVHGTTEVARLGNPASHGCVRLDPAHAQIFFELVEVYGMAATTITVQ